MSKKYCTIVLFAVAIVAFWAVSPVNADIICDFENGSADYDNADPNVTGLFRDVSDPSWSHISNNGAANDYLIMDHIDAGLVVSTVYDTTPGNGNPFSVFKTPVGETTTSTVDFELIYPGSGAIGGIPGLSIFDPVNNSGLKLEVLHRNSGLSDGRLGFFSSESAASSSYIIQTGAGSFPIAAVNDLRMRMSLSITNNGTTADVGVLVYQIPALGGANGTQAWNYSTTLNIGTGAGELNMDLANNGLEVLLTSSPHSGQNELHFDNLDVTGPPVPEPSTLALLASGLIGLLAYAWKKRK